MVFLPPHRYDPNNAGMGTDGLQFSFYYILAGGHRVSLGSASGCSISAHVPYVDISDSFSSTTQAMPRPKFVAMTTNTSLVAVEVVACVTNEYNLEACSMSKMVQLLPNIPTLQQQSVCHFASSF